MNKDDVQRQNRRARSLEKFYEITSPTTGRVYYFEKKRNADRFKRMLAQKAREVKA